MSYLLGIITLIIAVISYSFYFADILKGKTKPHVFTWFVWAVLNSFIFYQQTIHDGGPGAWVTGAAALANIGIVLFALKYGERNITRLDWLCLTMALAALLVWFVSPGGELSVVLASLVFVVGFVPTFRKSLKDASEETAITFALNSSKFLIALFALQTISVTTTLYPAVLFIVNGYFAIFLVSRQLAMKHKRKRV